MSFNKTTKVTQTGLGDDQFDQLQNNQRGLGSQIEEGFSGAETNLNKVNTAVSGLGTKIDTAGNSVNENTNTGFSNLNTYLVDQFRRSNNNFNQLSNNQQQGFSQLDTRNQNRFNTLDASVDSVGSDVETGFNEQTSRFNTLDTAVDRGFSDAETQLSNFAGQADSRFNTLDAANRTTQNNLTSGFAETQGDVENMQSEVLGGQGSILSDLSAAKSERGAYQTANSEAMADLQGTTDEFRSNFDQYVERYTDNSTLQNDTLGNIQSGLTNFAGDITNTVGGLGDRINTGLASVAGNVSNSVGNLGRQIGNSSDKVRNIIEGGFSNTSNQVGNLGDALRAQGSATQGAIEGGFADSAAAMSDVGNTLQAQGAATQGAVEQGFASNASNISDLSNALTTGFGRVSGDISGVGIQTDKLPGMLRSLSMLESVPTEMRQQYYQLSNSFDAQGNLIRNSVDENGNTIVRQLDDQGNLILRRFSVQGDSLGQMALNLSDVRDGIANLPNLPGASSGMGQLSAPMQDIGVGQGGFTSPYGRTQ